MYAVHTAGSFKVEQDPYLGYVVSGSYDYNLGDWNQSYIVTNLYASGSMIWTAKDDASDVCRYERCCAFRHYQGGKRHRVIISRLI